MVEKIMEKGEDYRFLRPKKGTFEKGNLNFNIKYQKNPLFLKSKT